MLLPVFINIKLTLSALNQLFCGINSCQQVKTLYIPLHLKGYISQYVISETPESRLRLAELNRFCCCYARARPVRLQLVCSYSFSGNLSDICTIAHAVRFQTTFVPLRNTPDNYAAALPNESIGETVKPVKVYI